MSQTVIILGLSYNYHDATACIVRNGVPIAAAEEERFSRQKHDTRFPERAIAYCLHEAGIAPANLDCIAFYEKPACKLERALRIGKEYAPSSTANAQFPLLINEGMGVELTVHERLNFKGPVYFSEHHLSHAASAFFCSPFEGFPRAVCCTTKTSDYRSSSIADQSASRLSTIHSELL
jgi:carbamoyltransferase